MLNDGIRVVAALSAVNGRAPYQPCNDLRELSERRDSEQDKALGARVLLGYDATEPASKLLSHLAERGVFACRIPHGLQWWCELSVGLGIGKCAVEAPQPVGHVGAVGDSENGCGRFGLPIGRRPGRRYGSGATHVAVSTGPQTKPQTNAVFTHCWPLGVCRQGVPGR